MAGIRLFGSALHEHADPARRIAGVATLAPDSEELAALLAADPAPEVRAAAAGRCTHLDALAAAWEAEPDPAVRAAIAPALGAALALAPDGVRAAAVLGATTCTDAIRADVVHRAAEADRRRGALAAIRDEAALIELALGAELAETRLAAAECVHGEESLRKLADAAENKDRGVARHARKRLDAIGEIRGRAVEADALLEQLEALASKPGPILTAVIELNRRWQALDLRDDLARLARCDAARQALQARFDREHEEQRARARFERRVDEWVAAVAAPASADSVATRRDELAALRDDLARLRDEGATHPDAAVRAKLDTAADRLARCEQEAQALAGAEALVVEAEQLAAGTSIDNAKLPERWQALDRETRTPSLTRRFEAALLVVEQRRLAQVRAAEQEMQAARQRVHSLLHVAEQALAAGQLQAARTAVDDIRAHKGGAGLLPKPTIQRLGRVTQQLTELERWESFGQRQARVQLCERAEGAIALATDPPRAAVEVQKLRKEWQALDQQHPGVPGTLWERFDRACEKAYAPAARYFAEQAALRKQARKQRDEFIAAAAAHAPTLLAEPRDWRAIERWLRETEQRWREGELGSVEPKAWKAFDAQLKAALAPLRDALAAARDEAKARRTALIEEVTALAARATEREAPSQVKAIQARWQAQAKELSLPQRDERALWERFRAACDAVFQAREAQRRQEDDRKHEGRRALEEICAQLEELARANETDEQRVRRTLRDLQDQWRQKTRAPHAAPRGLEARFASAKAAVDAALAGRSRAREAALWQTLAAKERLCDTLDAGSRARTFDPANVPDDTAARERWAALPVLAAAWERAMLGRRDAALAALTDASAASAHVARIARGALARREMLLELEMSLGLDSPPELKAQRLALQVKRLRDRFQSASAPGAHSAAERLAAWCAEPGVADAQDRERIARVFAAIERAR
jgi:hypothetical protein